MVVAHTCPQSPQRWWWLAHTTGAHLCGAHVGGILSSESAHMQGKRLHWRFPPLPLCAPQQWCLASMAGLGFLHVHLRLWQHPQSSPFRLSPRSQHQSFPLVRPPKPKLQHPAPPCPTPHWQTQVSGLGVLGGTDCAVLPLLWLQQTSRCTLLQGSEAPPPSQLITPPVRGLPRVQEPFLFHSSLPGAQVPSQFFFLLSYSVTWRFSCPFRSLRSSASVQ